MEMTASPIAQRSDEVGGRGRAGSIGATVSDILRADSDRARAQRDALTAFVVRAASAAILYLSQVVLARWMGGYEYGVYVFVWTWVLVLGGLSHVGLNMTMIRLVPEYRETGRLDLLRGLLRGGRLLALGLSTAIAAFGMAGLWLLGDRVADHYLLPAYLALVCVPMYTLTDVQDGIGRGSSWMAIALLPPYVLRPLTVLLAMVLAHEAGLPMNASTAAAAAILATWAAALVQTLLIGRRLEREVPDGSRTYDFRLWLATALPLLVIGGCEMLMQTTDVLVVSRYLGPTEVGIYFAAAKTMSLILFVHYAVGSALANRFSALNARGDKEQLAAFVRDAVHWTFWPSLAAAAAILALGRPLLWLFGPQFVEGYPVMFVLVLGFLGRAAMGPSEFLLNMLGEQRRCAAVLAAAAALNIALNFALVPVFGLVGAASATATALIAAALMNYVVARRRLGLDIAVWANLAKPARSGALSASGKV
jgi:O-antigen/teichoic acid export membrane protein